MQYEPRSRPSSIRRRLHFTLQQGEVKGGWTAFKDMKRRVRLRFSAGRCRAAAGGAVWWPDQGRGLRQAHRPGLAGGIMTLDVAGQPALEEQGELRSRGLHVHHRRGCPTRARAGGLQGPRGQLPARPVTDDDVEDIQPSSPARPAAGGHGRPGCPGRGPRPDGHHAREGWRIRCRRARHHGVGRG